MSDDKKEPPYIEVRQKRARDLRSGDVIRISKAWCWLYDVYSDQSGWNGDWTEDMKAVFGGEPADADTRDVFIRYALDSDRTGGAEHYEDRTHRYRNPFELVDVQVEVPA